MEQSCPGLAPHGGELVDRVLRGPEREEALSRALTLKQVILGSISVSDLELLAVGAYSPLTGFMGQEDYRRVVEEMRLANGLVWTIPITLPVPAEEAGRLKAGEDVALVDEGGRILGILRVRERFSRKKQHEAAQVYRTTDEAHPGVARLYAQSDVLLSGEIWLIERPADRPFFEFRHDPIQSRRFFAQRGWGSVVGFQTRNPIHRAHEYIQKCALEVADGLFLHPLVGETKEDDIPADVRMESYQSLLRDYYPPDRVILGVFPAAMRYAGPREAVFHALARKNYGCTHFIVGRDHAGIGKYYGTYDAQKIFDEFAPHELGIAPLFFEHTFYCRKCGGMASLKTCHHDPSNHVLLSGTQVREMLQRGEPLPPEFTRPEVAAILANGVRGKKGEEVGRPKVREQRAEGKSVRPAGGRGRKVFVIGLDSAPPELVFEAWREDLPHLKRLMEGGCYGRLESAIPAITVPAWISMMTGKDPGQLGVYGFRNRADHSYQKMTTANSAAVKEEAVWDLLSKAGKKVIVVGVPPSYPPKPVNGYLVSCFLTPDTSTCRYTYPEALRGEIEAVVGRYLVDVENFRTEDKADLLRRIYEMTEKHFRVIRHLIRTRDWDFFMFVEIGLDRIHHGFWKYWDRDHPKHVPGSPYENAIKAYYQYLDREIGELLSLLDGETAILVVSDHGAKRMDGGICLNEWLMQEGYLRLKEQPPGIVPLEKAEVDWGRTLAWGAGGYYGRLFLNVKGREPQGTIDSRDYESIRDELVEKLGRLTDQKGRPLRTRAFKPQEIYRECRGIPPDLIIYFGDLDWRAVGSIGHGAVHTLENDTGPDDANHAQHGIFIFSDPRVRESRRLEGLHLMDCAPTILNLFGLPVPKDMRGRKIL